MRCVSVRSTSNDPHRISICLCQRLCLQSRNGTLKRISNTAFGFLIRNGCTVMVILMDITGRQNVNCLLLKKRTKADIVPESPIWTSGGERKYRITQTEEGFCAAPYHLRWGFDNASLNNCGFDSFINRRTGKMKRERRCERLVTPETVTDGRRRTTERCTNNLCHAALEVCFVFLLVLS